MAGIRNMVAEKNAVDRFIQQRKKKPETPDDWAAVHTIAYPTINDLPEELMNETTKSYYAGANTAPPAKPSLADLQGKVEQTSEQYDELSKPNSALRILQEAIRAKSGTAQIPLGESEIFKQAGVGGMGALSASLNARSTEIKTNFANFSNIIGQMSGTYKEMAGNALTKYQIATDNYNRERDYLEALDKDMRDHEQSIELLDLKHQMDIELKKMAPQPDIADIREGEKYGYAWETGEWKKMRTDRHSNPTAMTTDVAATLGLIEGVDYERGDAFPDNPNLFTAKFLGDPVNTTIKALNASAESGDRQAFYTQGGGQRWTHTAMSDEDWTAKTPEEKREVIKEMYKKEGGSGELFGEGSLMDNISATAQLFYNGKYVPKTPSQYDTLVDELADAGLELPFNLDAKAIISGIYESYRLLTKIPDDKRGQIEGRFQEYTAGEERDEDVQAFKSQVSMVGMFMARLIEKGRMSDDDRKFYLKQMPSLKQSDDAIAKKSAETLAGIIGEQFNMEAPSMETSINQSSSGDLSTYLEQDYIIIQNPDTGELRQFDKGTLNAEDLQDALNDGFIIIN